MPRKALSGQPCVLLHHRLRLHHHTRFSLNFIAFSLILSINVRCLSSGERGMDWKKLLGPITESVDEELWLRNAYLGAANRILRQQISGRIQLSASDHPVLPDICQ